MISSAVSASGSIITSAPIVASSFSPIGPRSSSVWMRTTVCSTPNSLASNDARRLTSSFWVTPASNSARSMPAARSVDGTVALPTTTCTSSSAPIAAAITSSCSTTTTSFPSAPSRWARYQPTSPAPTITTCIVTACLIDRTDRERQARRRPSVTVDRPRCDGSGGDRDRLEQRCGRGAQHGGGVGVGEVVAAGLGAGDELAGGVDRRRDAVVRAQDGERLVLCNGIERRPQQLEEFRRRSVAERQRAQHRQGVDPLDDVVAGRLAELLVGGGDVQDVVDDLEHGAVGVAVLGERVDDRAVVAGDDATDARRGAVQRRGLAVDRGEVAGLGARAVVGVAELFD